MSSDTPRPVERTMFELWRAATPSQRLQKAFGMGRMINELARSELRRQHPDAAPRELELRLAARVLDRDTMIRVFGWDPDTRGR